jgi:signal transduction histidine kinase
MDASRDGQYGLGVRLRPTPTRFDLALALGVIVLGEVEIWVTSTYEGPRAITAPAALVAGAALLWRRSAPPAVIAVLVALQALTLAYDPAPVDHDATSEALPLLVAVFSAGAYARGRAAAASGVMVATAIVLRTYLDVGPRGTLGDALGSLLFFGLVIGGDWLAGMAVGRRRTAEATAEESATRRAAGAVADERARIARELHDVVAHAISVIVLQAKGGRRVLERDPAQARAAFDAIANAGGEALVEMRHLLEMLSGVEDAPGLEPQPRLENLELLAEQVRGAGLPVELRVEGEPIPLAPGVDLSAYRIVQEALTNALKHAGAAHASVLVAYGHGELRLEIRDDGRGPNGDAYGNGHGLVGMRERALMLGGRIETGGRDDGGFAVRAVLPLEPAR